MFNFEVKNNIWKFYLIKFLYGLCFALPIMSLFWADNGLSLTEIMLLQSLFSIATFVFEIPSGYFADKFGRKKTIVFAAIFYFLGSLIYCFGFDFFTFLIAELLLGLGVSFLSGADDALLYDSLKENKQEKNYKKIYGNANFVYFLSIAFSSIIGGFVGALNFRFDLMLTAFAGFLFIPIAILLKEPKVFSEEKDVMQSIPQILKSCFIKNKRLKWLLIFSGVLFGINQSVLWLYQPYFILSGLNVVFFGFVFASFQIVAAIASKFAHKIEAKIGQKFALMSLFVLLALSYLLMGSFVFWFSFSFAFLQQFIRGFGKVIVTDYINKEVSSSQRATVLSINSFLYRLIYALIIPFFGWFADVYSLLNALTIMGLTALVGGIIIIVILWKQKII